MIKFELLSNIDLVYYCKLLKIPLIEVLQKDLFEQINKPREGCYIVNLQDSNIGNGTHWTCLILTKTIAIYYDSFGLAIPTPIKKFIMRFNKKSKVLYSIDQIQDMKSVFCGWFVLYFLYFMTVLYKKSYNYRYLTNKHNAIFSLKNQYLNDRIIQKLIKYTSLDYSYK